MDKVLAKEMLERNYPGLDFDKTKKARKKLMAEHIDRYGIELKPGAKEILKYLTMKRIPAMVATATEYELAEKCLMEVGLYDDLERIISASQIERGKPFPDIYKYACRTIDADPSNCYAVEDSLNGVRSAVAAGCNTIMVPDDVMPDVDLKKQLVLVTDSLINLILYFNKVL